jgi:hypothetical protein
MPLGLYYVKITDGAVIYYSDWIMVHDVSTYIKIAFSNSQNVGDLIYEDSFSQAVWLDAILGTPTHETVNTGEEKDGVFIAEKIVSKLSYSIICYVSRSMYQCLSRLPIHDTVTITDEVGNTYTPSVGNIIVDQPEWITFDTAKVTIKFNDNSNTQFSWTK